MIALRYAAFALIATAVNLTTQYLCIVAVAGPGSLSIALVFGTAAGLVTKYVLDNRWIFNDGDAGLQAHGRKFWFYTTTGMLTTALFWGMETTAAVLFRSHEAALLGGALGLALGYVAKFHLDRRFVFRRRRVG